MMTQLELSPLPVRVRPSAHETLRSYSDRLAKANWLAPASFARALKSGRLSAGSDLEHPQERVLEALGGLRAGHFSAQRLLLPMHDDGVTCKRCLTGLGGRFGCMQCTAGVVVEEEPHDGPRVCRRHMRWIGPGTLPERQYNVGVGVLRADRMYRRLRRASLLDSHRLAEVAVCVDFWADSESRVVIDPATRFVLAIALFRAALAPAKLTRFFDPRRDAATRYRELDDRVKEIVGAQPRLVLVDQLWLLLRTVGHATLPGPHRLQADPPHVNIDCTREMEQLRTSACPLELHLHLSQYVESDDDGDRLMRATRNATKNHYVCFAYAHRFQTSRFSLASAKHGGCGYCARARPYPGFNTLADTHPDVAAEWDYERNGNLRPEHLLAGSPARVWWRCANGHSFPQVVAARTGEERDGCVYCSNKKVDPLYNSLSLTHPDVAAGWHPSMNPALTPDTVAATSRARAWWLCPKGHDFPMPILKRVAGITCPYCRGRKVHPTTCLAVTHPQLAAQWHPTMNGDLTPHDVLAGQPDKVWWICANGHEFPQRINRRKAGDGCPFCANFQVCSDNCMRTTHPDLAAEFDPEKNAPKTPDNTFAGTTDVLWWRCVRGHSWDAPGQKRVTAKGCPICRNKRVLIGYNDMATTNPEFVNEWDDRRNRGLRPTDVVAGTGKPIWWRCAKGHVWRESGRKHLKRVGGCSECRRDRRMGVQRTCG